MEVTLEVAEKMLEAVERWASLAGNPCSIAVADRTGAVLAFHAMDGCEPWTADVAINKAFSAVYGGKSTYLLAIKLDPRNYAEELKEGVLTEPYQVGLLTQGKGRLIFVPGGYLVNDPDLNIIGAVGVSGFPQSVGMGEINDMTAAIIGVSAFYD